jgi:hypothetical protein
VRGQRQRENVGRQPEDGSLCASTGLIDSLRRHERQLGDAMPKANRPDAGVDPPLAVDPHRPVEDLGVFYRYLAR